MGQEGGREGRKTGERRKTVRVDLTNVFPLSGCLLCQSVEDKLSQTILNCFNSKKNRRIILRAITSTANTFHASSAAVSFSCKDVRVDLKVSSLKKTPQLGHDMIGPGV